MNEQIKQLMSKCNYAVDGTCDTSREEKFAELIIRECAEFARQHNLEKADRSHMIHKAIKQHFGVKE